MSRIEHSKEFAGNFNVYAFDDGKVTICAFDVSLQIDDAITSLRSAAMWLENIREMSGALGDAEFGATWRDDDGRWSVSAGGKFLFSSVTLTDACVILGRKMLRFTETDPQDGWLVYRAGERWWELPVPPRGTQMRPWCEVDAGHLKLEYPGVRTCLDTDVILTPEGERLRAELDYDAYDPEMLWRRLVEIGIQPGMLHLGLASGD